MSTELRQSEVCVGGAALHVVESGPNSGPAVLILRGWPQSALSWPKMMSWAGNDGHQAIAVDLAGVGRSAAERIGPSSRTRRWVAAIR
jgi:pimeloyl-ACP methyl ester carboxylesterase